ncbi:MAG: hypothetical protein ACKVWV_11490 [Planctomycetota bacterium]
MIASIASVALVLASHAPQDLDEHEAPCEIEAPSLAYRVEPFVDLYFTVQRRAASYEETPAVEGLDAAVELARALGVELHGAFDTYALAAVVGCENGEQAARAFAKLPETVATRARSEVPLRAPAVEFARALARAEPAFRSELWPAHADEIAQARARIEGEFDQHFPRCIELAARELGFPSMPQRITLFLVHDSPAPRSLTQRDADGRGVSFVAVSNRDGSQLYDAILHEALVAADVTSRGSVLDRLRERLERAGFGRERREWHELPRVLLHVEAGEIVRRIVEPTHRHRADAEGLYAAGGRSSLVAWRIWLEHLDGKLEVEAALDAIVREVVGPDQR